MRKWQLKVEPVSHGVILLSIFILVWQRAWGRSAHAHKSPSTVFINLLSLERATSYPKIGKLASGIAPRETATPWSSCKCLCNFLFVPLLSLLGADGIYRMITVSSISINVPHTDDASNGCRASKLTRTTSVCQMRVPSPTPFSASCAAMKHVGKVHKTTKTKGCQPTENMAKKRSEVDKVQEQQTTRGPDGTVAVAIKEQTLRPIVVAFSVQRDLWPITASGIVRWENADCTKTIR